MWPELVKNGRRQLVSLMSSNTSIFLMILAGVSLAACTEIAGNADSVGLVRYEPGAVLPLAADRKAIFLVEDGYAKMEEQGRGLRLSALDFEASHVLVGEVTADGINELLIEVLPSRSGGCYKLWSSAPSGFLPHADLFCNPLLTARGSIVSDERDGPYTRVTEYANNGAGALHWVSRQEPLSPDFARLVNRLDDGSTASVVIFPGLPECGEAKVAVQHPVAIAETPAARGRRVAAGELRILDVAGSQFPGGMVLVQASDGASGWLPAWRLGDLGEAAKEQCSKARDVTRA